MSELLVLGCVDLRKFDLALHVGGGLVPLRFELLAVTAPGRVKLNHPNVFAAIHSAVKSSIVKHNHIAVGDRLTLGTTTAATAGRGAGAALATGSLVDLGLHVAQSKVPDRIGITALLVVTGVLLVETEPLDRRESLDVVRSTDILVFGHIHSSDLDNSLELAGDLLPLRCECLAMAAPGCIEFNKPELVAAHDLLLPVAAVEQHHGASLVVKSIRYSQTRGKK